MNKNKFTLYIEGTSDANYGDLREGFSELMSQKLRNNMPRIIMKGGGDDAIKSFKKPRPGDNPLLIIDLDQPEENKLHFLKSKNLENKGDKIFFMIQEMEAWFLSQPLILDDFYNSKISVKITRKCSEIPEPSDFLKNITKNIDKKEPYHKVKHGVELLKRLDLIKLMAEFPDVKKLIEKLNE